MNSKLTPRVWQLEARQKWRPLKWTERGNEYYTTYERYKMLADALEVHERRLQRLRELVEERPFCTAGILARLQSIVGDEP